MLSSASDKAKLFVKNFSKNSNLDDSGISLFVFLSRTNVKLHNQLTYPGCLGAWYTGLGSQKRFFNFLF